MSSIDSIKIDKGCLTEDTYILRTIHIPETPL